MQFGNLAPGQCGSGVKPPPRRSRRTKGATQGDRRPEFPGHCGDVKFGRIICPNRVSALQLPAFRRRRLGGWAIEINDAARGRRSQTWIEIG